jgi:hypothetical protein
MRTSRSFANEGSACPYHRLGEELVGGDGNNVEIESCRLVLGGRHEELQGNVVGITEGQRRAVIGIHDTAIGNPEFSQPEFPRFELISTTAVKSQIVQTYSTLIEGDAVGLVRKLMKSDERVTSDEPDCSSKWAGTLVQEHLGLEQALVPRNTAVEITDSESHMGDCRNLGHGVRLAEPVDDDGNAGAWSQANELPRPPGRWRHEWWQRNLER